MSARPGAPRVLHVHGSLAADDAAAQRDLRLINAFGTRLRHSFVAADGGAAAALDRLGAGIASEQAEDFPALGGWPSPARLQRIARAMAGYDLVLSHDRGAIDAALAHTMFSQVHALPPLIHHEDGSDETVRQRRGLRSRWSRRIGLGRAAGLVVPTEVMEGTALVDWQQPLGRVKLIRDGVDLKRLAAKVRPDAIPRLLKRRGELWLACFARFAGEKQLELVLDALARVAPGVHLVLSGTGPERERIEAEIARRGLYDRVHILPSLSDPALLIALADMLVVAGGREPLPRPILLAMGAGKPVAGFEQGEIAVSLSLDNRDYIVAPGDGAGLAMGLERLAADAFLRQRIGAANRERAEAERDETVMIAAYRRLYASAMQRDRI